MLFFENFLTFVIKNRKGDNNLKVNIISEFYENYSASDILDNNIYIEMMI